ncbi:MAG: tetratricopeptide repeat protein [Phycisphaerales bacterium]|nr:tetratricopeptide repeat protein [Phycisphaerales bacterium]
MNRANVSRLAVAGSGLAMLLGMGLAGCSQRPLSSLRADGNYYYYRGDYSSALPYYQEVVDRKGGNAEGHYELGRTLLALGRASEAREQMVLANSLEPENMEYFDGLADAFVATGDEDQLFQALEHQARDRGGVADYLRMGRYALKLGHPDEAERALLGAAEIDDGKTPAPQLALADFYHAIGDKDNEVRRLRMALWFDPADTEIQTRLRELGQIPGPTFVLEPSGRD